MILSVVIDLDKDLNCVGVVVIFKFCLILGDMVIVLGVLD